jgi:hypothetical protein
MTAINTQIYNELRLTKTEKSYIRRVVRQYSLGEISSLSTGDNRHGDGEAIEMYFDDFGNNKIIIEITNRPQRGTILKVFLHCDDDYQYEHLNLFIRPKNNK